MKESYYFAGKTAILVSIAIPEESDNYVDFGIKISNFVCYVKDNDEHWNEDLKARIGNNCLPEQMNNEGLMKSSNDYYICRFLGKHDSSHYLVAITGSRIVPNKQYSIYYCYKRSDGTTLNNKLTIKTLPDIGKITCGTGSLRKDEEIEGTNSNVDGINNFPQGVYNAITEFIDILNLMTTIDYRFIVTTSDRNSDYLYLRNGSDSGAFDSYLNIGTKDTSEVPVTLMDLAGSNLMSNQSDPETVLKYMLFATNISRYWIWRENVCYPVRGYDLIIQTSKAPNNCYAYLYKMAAAYQASRGVPKYYLYDVIDLDRTEKYYSQQINGIHTFRIPCFKRDTIKSNIPFEEKEIIINGHTILKTYKNPDDKFKLFGTLLYSFSDYKGPYKIQSSKGGNISHLWYKEGSSYLITNTDDILSDDLKVATGTFINATELPESTGLPESTPDDDITLFLKTEDEVFIYDPSKFSISSYIKPVYDIRTTEYYIPSIPSWTLSDLKFKMIYNYGTRDPKQGLESVDLKLYSENEWYAGKLDGLYAWGETKGKTGYTLYNYKFYDNLLEKYTKYNNVDNIKQLLLEDDVAYVLFGGLWKIPSKNEILELIEGNNYKNWSITTSNNIKYAEWNGVKFELDKNYWLSECLDDSHANAIIFNEKSDGTLGYEILSNVEKYKKGYIKPVLNTSTFPFYNVINYVKNTNNCIDFKLVDSQIKELKNTLSGYYYSHMISTPSTSFPEELFKADWKLCEFDFKDFNEDTKYIYLVYKDEKLFKLESSNWTFYLDEVGRPFKVELNDTKL